MRHVGWALDQLADAGRRTAPILIPMLLVAILTAVVVGAIGIIQDLDEDRRSRENIEEILENQLDGEERDAVESDERLQKAFDFLVAELTRLDVADQKRTAAILHNQDHIRQDIAALRREIAEAQGRPGPPDPAPAPAPPGLQPNPADPGSGHRADRDDRDQRPPGRMLNPEQPDQPRGRLCVLGFCVF